MKFFLSLVSLPTLLTAAIPQAILPNGQTVKQDVINIHNAVLALDATIQAYTGTTFPTSLVEGTPVLLGVAEIHRVNRAGFRHALASLPFSKEDSLQIVDTVSDTVDISIPASTKHIEAKIEEFKKGLLTPTVIASLTLLLSDHDTFSAAVLSKLDSGIGEAKMKQGADAVANIHNAIQDAIVFYTVNSV